MGNKKKHGHGGQSKQPKHYDDAPIIGDVVPGYSRDGYGGNTGLFCPDNDTFCFFEHSDHGNKMHTYKRDPETKTFKAQPPRTDHPKEFHRYLGSNALPWGPDHLFLIPSWDDLVLYDYKENNVVKVHGPCPGTTSMYMHPDQDDQVVRTLDGGMIHVASASVDPRHPKFQCEDHTLGTAVVLEDGRSIVIFKAESHPWKKTMTIFDKDCTTVLWTKPLEEDEAHPDPRAKWNLFPVPDGRVLVSSSAEGEARKYWELDTSSVPFKLGKEHHTKSIFQVEQVGFFPNGNILLVQPHREEFMCEVHDIGLTEANVKPFFATRKGIAPHATLLGGSDSSAVQIICSNDASVTELPDLSGCLTAKAIGAKFCQGMAKLVTVNLVGLDEVKTIREKAFAGCSGLKDLSLGFPALQTINSGFCNDLPSLERVDISKCPKIEHIGDSFVRGCTALKEFTIPALVNLETIGSFFLVDCTALVSLMVAGPCPKFTAINGAFLSGCRALEMLDLAGFTHVTTAGCDRIAFNCTKISRDNANLPPRLSEKVAVGSTFFCPLKTGQPYGKKQNGGNYRMVFDLNGSWHEEDGEAGFQGGAGWEKRGSWRATAADTIDVHVALRTEWVDCGGGGDDERGPSLLDEHREYKLDKDGNVQL